MQGLGGNADRKSKEEFEEVLDYKLSWEDLTFSDKAKLFRWWSILTATANMIQMFGALFFIFKSYTGLMFSETLCGLGCMLSWIALVQYLEYSPEYSFISKTLKFALPKVFRTFVGVMPIFFGVSMLGVCLFYTTFKF
jgi:hypothetical protein